MWSFYFKSAFRSISRKKLFTGLNVAGIAIGISVFLLSLQFYSYERGYNTFHDHLAQLYRVGTKGKDGRSLSTFPPLGPLLQNNIPGVHRAVRLAENFNDGAIISYQPDDKKQSLRSFREDGCVFADEAFLETFHFPLIAGSNLLDQANAVVITSAAASHLFGKDQAVGQIIHLHNQFGDLSAKVVGVTADVPEQSDIRFQYLFSIHMLENPSYTEGSDWAKPDNWGNDAYSTYVWLQPNAQVSVVERIATDLWRRNDPDYSRKSGSVFLQPVADMHLGTSWKDETPSFGSYALTSTVLALGILILFIAWINYINFSTADALSRAKEIGIHKIVGSMRTQIVWKAITESVVLNFIAVLLACMLTQLLQGLFNYATQRPLSFVYIGNVSYFVVALSILLGGSLACGLYTGLLLSRLNPITALHLNDAGKIGNALLRKGLVVFQLTVACTFIAITMVAFRQISFMKHQNLGMKIDRLVVITGPAIKDSTFKSNSILFRTEVSRMPFIEKFTSSGSTPGTGSGHNFSADGITGVNQAPGNDHTEYSISIVDENFFPTYQIPLLYGGNFDKSDAAKGFKGDKLIVNETAARSLGYSPEKAVGQTIRWGKNYIITGVAHDYHHRSLKDPIESIIYVPQYNNAYYTIMTEPEDLAGKMQHVKAIYEKLYPGNSFAWHPLRETFDQLYSDDNRTAIIALSLAMLIIAISGLGLLGLAAFTARRRTKEMGIRKVLGASVLSLFANLSKEYVWLVIVSFLIATPISWLAAQKWLESFAYRIRTDWTMFAAAGALCLAFTMATVTYHALRTAFVNATKQLRTD